MKSLLKLVRSLWFVGLLALFGLGLGTAALAIGYDGKTQPTIVYDAPAASTIGYDAVHEQAANETRNGTTGNRVLCAKFAGFVAAKSADTIAEGLRISPYRVTAPGETFIRYESANPAFTRITPSGGVTPGTFAAPASDGLIPVADRVPVYNLPSPQIPRPNATTLTPPPGTPIIGPRPVVGGTGNEVIFPMGY